MKRTHGHGTASAKAVKNAYEKQRIRDYLVDLIGLKILKFVSWASGDFVKLAWVLQLYSLLSSPFESQKQSNNQLRSDNYAVYLQKTEICALHCFLKGKQNMVYGRGNIVLLRQLSSFHPLCK